MDMSRLNKIILQDFDKHPLYIPTYAVALATFTGMRVGELAALRWEDISEETIIIDVLKSTIEKQRNIILILQKLIRFGRFQLHWKSKISLTG